MARMKMTTVIPEDIILEIVTRLPIKSIGRCRCVCKRWRFLLSTPNSFAELHRKAASERQTLCQRLIFFNHEQQPVDLELGKLEDLENSPLRAGQLNAPFKKPDHTLCFLGSCNGLVACFSGDPTLIRGHVSPSKYYVRTSLFIWNPSTGFYKEITNERFYLRSGVHARGFGYVSSTNDYKVVLTGMQPLCRSLSLYSLRTETLKTFKSAMRNPRSKGLLMREALHWLAYERNDTKPFRRFRYSGVPKFVFAFDLAKEEFRKMQVPSSTITKSGYDRSSMGASCEGYLCIMHVRWLNPLSSDFVIDFWFMRDYGNSDSWSRSVSLRITDEPGKRICRICMPEPIFLQGTRAFVLSGPEKLTAVDHGKREEKMPDHIYTVHDKSKQGNAGMYLLYSIAPDMIVYEESLTEYHGVEKALINPLRTTKLYQTKMNRDTCLVTYESSVFEEMEIA